MGIMLPKMIARLKSFSCPFISSRSSGIEVKPSRAKRMTPIGNVKYVGLNVRRFCVWIFGRNVMKMNIMIAMIARTPHVSIFLRPLNPSFNRRVIVNQNIIPKIIGWMFPGISFDIDSPSPIR